MKKISCIILLLVLILPSFLNDGSTVASENESIIISSEQYEKGYRYNTHGWIYLHIEGEPYERGYQYGYLLADEIVDIIQRWNHIFPQKWSWKIQKNSAMRLFWNKYPEEYKQEIKGIADGVADRGGKIDESPVTYKDILTLNEMYESQTRFRTFAIPPLRWFYNWLFISRVLKKEYLSHSVQSDSNQHFGKCSAFLATGDATIDGRIVASQSTFGSLWNVGSWHHYISERFNVILDIQPTEGYRVLMTTSPGLIWSDEDFNQNDAGVILMGTSLQMGPWSRFGDPTAIRSRKAIQYSDSIDEMVNCLLEKNNGLYPNDWLIGDTKTGEIASLELALRHHALTRTKNGVIWSCNNAKDDKVRWEINSFTGLGIFGRIIWKDFIPNDRDIKFEELSEQYYGKIDIDIVKIIMSTHPINQLSIDTKITDTQMVENFGIWAFMGKPGGTDFIADDHPLDKETPGYTDLPGCGWIQLFAGSSQNNYISNKQQNVQANNGKTLWDLEMSKGALGNAIYSSPMKDENVLYSTSENGNVSAIDINTKNLLWETNIGQSSRSSPLKVGNTVYIGSSDGLYALDKETGKVLWDNEIGAVFSKPAFFNSIVYCGSTNGKIYGFDSENGDMKFSFEIDEEIYCSPVTNDRVLYIGSNDGFLYAIDIKEKDLKWKFETDGPVVSAPLVINDVLYFGSWDSNLYALDSKAGKLKWKFTTGWGIDSTPAFYDNTIYVGSEDNNFYAVDADDGALKWMFTTNGGIQSSPTVYGGFVFFGSSDGKMYALDASNGDLVWSNAPDYHIQGIYNYVTKPIVSSPIAYDGKIYVGSTNGKIYCFDAQTFEPLVTTEEEIKIPVDTWVFLIVPLLCVILVTLIYLSWTRRKSS